MSVGAWGRTWEDASTPSAARLTRRYEKAWREAGASGPRPDPRAFLSGWAESGGFTGARLALLRTDMSLRWEAGQRASADWYAQHFPEVGEDTIVALIYEEYCLLEEMGEPQNPDAFLERYAPFAEPLRRVLDIHRLVGSASTSAFPSGSTSLETLDGSSLRPRFPESGDSIAGFQLVEEVGRGSFARVFLARETELADRLVALKLSLRGSREPQTLARLQHTHIVPIYSHRVDAESGLHLLCMPYFGRVTLARVMTEVERAGRCESPTGAALVDALDRLEPVEGASSGPSAGREALESRTFPQAVAWWGACLAEALAHAHDRGVLHRDVKPSNVLIASDGTPMLLDFNLAHEAVVPHDPGRPASGLGGTVDYMAPEHLEALAEGRGDHVDARSDVYSLGVLLYETAFGAKPFAPPRKTGSVIESLLAAADERRNDPRALFQTEAAAPAPLRSVLLRCLAPDPEDRYQTADDLAIDLQAVADDFPLAFAREPLWSRAARRLRRNRVRFVTAALVLISCAAAGAAAINLNMERTDRYEQARRKLGDGDVLMSNREYDKAGLQFEAALQFVEGPDQGFLGRVFDWRNIWDLFERVRVRLGDPDAHSDLERLEERAKEKVQLAARSAAMRGHAEALHEESEILRMRFIGVGEDRVGAAERLQDLLKPFFVLGPKDWTTLDHNLNMLAPEERTQLRTEVDELLFLWMVGLDAALEDSTAFADDPGRDTTLALAVDVCDKALRFTGPAGPWRELRRRFQNRRSQVVVEAGGPEDLEPARIETEPSPLVCFQWGLLRSSRRENAEARRWLRRAVRIDGSNYWYRFYLGYLEDQAGARDQALDQYEMAAAVKPDSPWVLYSRARLYRRLGEWVWADEDLKKSLTLMHDRAEARMVHLELGYVRQALGDFSGSRMHYHEVLKNDPLDKLGLAAWLNLANLDAESGAVDRAMATYGEILALDPNDSATRLSRALLDLRIGRPESAATALDQLIDQAGRNAERSDLLATRTIVQILLGRYEQAVVDAREARRLDASPARDRLVERALLAAGRIDDLQLDRPNDLAHLPVGGPRLQADLSRAEPRLAEAAQGGSARAYRASLTWAVVLSSLNRHADALRAADAALIASNRKSSDAHLIAARVAHRAGNRLRAAEEVDLGLLLEPDDPGLLELRGALRIEASEPGAALDDLERAVSLADSASAHARKAEALQALGLPEQAVLEWTAALRRDPEYPGAHLQRARCYLDRSRPAYDLALVDLEQAAAWSRNDPAAEIGVVLTYARCLAERPNRLSRWLTLLRRTANFAWSGAQPWMPLLVIGSRPF